MKKIFAIALISMVLVSCKKSNTPGIGTNGVQATFNNTTTVFNILTSATSYKTAYYYYNTDSVYVLQITAYNSASSQPYLSIGLTSNQAFAPGVYSDTAQFFLYSAPTPYSFYRADIEYGYNNNPFNMYQYYSTAGVKSSPTTVTITTITASSISGTFQGALYIGGDSTKLKQVITNGKFISNNVLNNYIINN